MEISLKGKVALVTGGSRGIGQAIASIFAQAGASVMITSRKKEGLELAQSEIMATAMRGSQVEYIAANAGEPETPSAVVSETISKLGSVDILVNNAATNPYYGPLAGLDPSRADKIMAINLRAALLWTQACWEQQWNIGESNGASVVNIASIGGMSVEAGIGYYNVSKAALIHLTRQMAYEFAPKVRVNSISPGLVRTQFAKALWEPHEEKVAKSLPLKRIGEPDDIAGAALFLASELSTWMTGHNLVVDGGALVSGGSVVF